MKLKLPTIAEDKRRAAFHEAGHAIVLEHFRCDWRAQLKQVAKRPSLANHAVVGNVQPMTQTTPFRIAVTGWGGLISETRFFDANESFEGFYDDFCCCDSIEEVSPTDRACLESHPQQLRAAKTAWGIVTRRWKEVEDIAGILIQDDALDAWRWRSGFRYPAV